jgi:prephenate dehydrogenase
MQIGTLAICGVGLLGGSVGLAAKARGIARRVIGIGRSTERLAEAVKRGAIDEATTQLAKGCAEADWVILASTVSHIIELLPQVAEVCKSSTIITDVGSTKATIVERAERVFPRGGPFFVGSHPMAGSERSGVVHASADLFQNACCIITPTRTASNETADRVAVFWRSLGARVVRLDPVQHDRVVSAVSHLPHMTAVGLLLVAAQLGEDPNLLATLIGNGFKDSTRVAAGPPEVWRDICLENRGPIADSLERLAEDLLVVAEEIRDGQSIRLLERLQRAQEFRKRLIP